MDAYACPNADCRHVGTCMAITSTEHVAKVNAETKASYLEETVRWNLNKKGKKTGPKMGKLMDQQIGCYCFLFFCRFLADGGNCPNCQHGRAGMYQVLDGDGKPHCTCDICNCKCSYVFNRNERHKLTAKNHQEKHQRQMRDGDEMKVDNSANLFYSSMHGMMENARIKSAQADGTSTASANINNALSTMSRTLLADDSIQNNVVMRNNIQKETPKTTTTRSGNSIGNECLGIIPTTNKRFYNNGLQRGSKRQPMPLQPAVRASHTGPGIMLRNTTTDEDSPIMEVWDGGFGNTLTTAAGDTPITRGVHYRFELFLR